MRVCITFNIIVVYDTHKKISSVISIGKTALQHVNHYVMGVKKVKNVIHQMVIKYASFDILEGPMSKLCDRREIAQKISMTLN